jgi:glycosyltransferase involved in cell wall biosynthesis
MRVAIICDLLEENWPSMALVADSLLNELKAGHADEIAATRVRPPMRRRFTSNGTNGGKRFNTDRLINRFRDYPRTLRRHKNDFDIFHIVDHSYAQLVHELPAQRTIVTCHDLDTFRCLVKPEWEQRSPLFKAIAKRVLTGMQLAAHVTCDSQSTRDALVRHNLVPADRLTVIPNGVHPSFSRRENRAAEREVERLLGPLDEESLELLHVGSTISRKRIDVLLNVFAKVRRPFPRARLVRAGGEFTANQRALVKQLDLRDSIVVLPHLSREALSAVYRRAALSLLPSEREGFGLPIVEALACGTPVIASDIPVMREVGAEAVTYCPLGEVDAWVQAVEDLLRERHSEPASWTTRQDAGVIQASRFTWREYVEKTVALYREVACACS